MMPPHDYLLSYGAAGDFGRFQSDEPLLCRRGERVVVRSHRGQELGVIMRPATDQHARLLDGKFTGQILRRATPGDIDLAERMRRRGQSLFQDARRWTAQFELPLEILDVEILLDGRQAILHSLHWADCDPRRLMDAIAEQYRLLVSLHDLAAKTSEEEEHDEPEAGCGLPGCGQAAGGCNSCSSGGCSTCSSHGAKHAPAEPAAGALPAGRRPIL